MWHTSTRAMQNICIGCTIGSIALLLVMGAQPARAEFSVAAGSEQAEVTSIDKNMEVKNELTVLARKSIRGKGRKYHGKRRGYGSHKYYGPSGRRYFRYHRNPHLKPRTFQFRYKGHSPYGKDKYRFQRRPHYKSPRYRYEYRRPYIYRRHSRPHPYPPRRKHYRH